MGDQELLRKQREVDHTGPSHRRSWRSRSYDARQPAQSDAALAELARLSQEMGLYHMDQRIPPRNQNLPGK